MNPSYSLRQLVVYALKLGSIGFGGPVALVGSMYQDLVERRKWISEAEYKEGLTLAQLAPGPLAAQLAIYFGYVHYRALGATLVGLAFALPSFLMVVALGFFYKLYGGLAWMQAVFYGVGACVIGIIGRSAEKLISKTVGKDPLLWVIFSVMTLTTFLTEQESVPLILTAGLLTLAAQRISSKGLHKKGVAWVGSLTFFAVACVIGFHVWQSSQSPVLLADQAPRRGGGVTLLWDIFWFFGKAGAFVFGSGLAIVPFLFHGVVKEFQWLNDQQFLDAVAVAMITPGPVVITTGFIGYLVAGFPGACVAAFATFFPCYLFTVIPAPFLHKHGAAPSIVALINGVTAAAVGAIAGAVIVLGKRSVIDLPTLLMALVTYAILRKVRRVSEPVLILISAGVGLLLQSS